MGEGLAIVTNCTFGDKAIVPILRKHEGVEKMKDIKGRLCVWDIMYVGKSDVP